MVNQQSLTKAQRNTIIRKIHGDAKCLKWDKVKLYELISNMGLGNSISKLTDQGLQRLGTGLSEHRKNMSGNLDSPGYFIYHLAKSLDWNTNRLNQLIINKFNGKYSYTFAENWRHLSEAQKGGAISILRRYQNM